MHLLVVDGQRGLVVLDHGIESHAAGIGFCSHDRIHVRDELVGSDGLDVRDGEIRQGRDPCHDALEAVPSVPR